LRFFDRLTIATIHAVNSPLETIGTFRWQISHIRQPEQEEGWLAAEIGTFRISRDVRWQAGMRSSAEVRRALDRIGVPRRLAATNPAMTRRYRANWKMA
jgi:hypothetical protein